MKELKSFLADDIRVFLKKKHEDVRTKNGYETICYHMQSFDAFLYVSQTTVICEEFVLSWIQSLSDLADGTINNYISTVREFLLFENQWRSSRHFVPVNRKVSDNYVPHYYNEEEKNLFYPMIDNYDPGVAIKLPWIKAEFPMVIRICDGCGTRITETLQLKMKDVDLKAGVLKMVNSKNNKQRYVPMTQDLTEILRKYCFAMKITDDLEAYLFPGRTRDTCLKDREIRGKFLGFLIIANIRKTGSTNHTRGPCVHDFRHTFAINALRKLLSLGIDVSDVHSILSVYLGHEGLRETEKYLKFCTELFPEEIDKFDQAVDALISGEDLWEKYGL